MSKFVINKYSPDKKNLSVLFTFLSWLIIGFIVCFLGINNIFAATYYLNYQYTQQYYNNHGNSVEAINTSWNESLQSYISGNIPTTANSYGAGLAISSPIPILANHTYSISFYFDDIYNIALSSKKNIAIGLSLASASGNYSSNNFWAETIQSTVKNNSIIQYVFKANGGADYIFIPWTTTTSLSQSYVVTQMVMEDLGSEGLSQEQINSSLNNQTNELNNSIQSSTNIITGEIDDMEQNIIDSNKETQEVIKDQFNSCKPSNNLFNATLIPSSTGIVVNDDGSTITMPIMSEGNGAISTKLTLSQLAPDLKVGDTVYLNFNSTSSYNRYIYISVANKIWYVNSSNVITQEMLNGVVSLYANRAMDGNMEQVILSNFMMSYSITTFEPYGETCSNILDEQAETQKGIWATIKELPSMFLDMLLGLFIPKDLSFIDEFKEVISNKLGFIASVPIQIIDFTLGLVNVAFEEITTISFPSIEIFGVHFWNAEEIDITILLEKLKPFKYFTDFTCVILCCRTLYKFYNTFTGGEAN